MHIRITSAGRRIHLLSFYELGRALASGEVDTSHDNRWEEWAARAFLSQHFYDSCQIGALRSALAADLCDVGNLSDDEIIAAAAQRLCSGAWCIGYEQLPINSGGRDTSAPARAGATGISAALRRGGAPRPAPASAKHAQSTATPAKADWHKQTDQAALAKALEHGAKSRAPFFDMNGLPRLPVAPALKVFALATAMGLMTMCSGKITPNAGNPKAKPKQEEPQADMGGADDAKKKSKKKDPLTCGKPGDMFDSAEEAAISAIAYINEKSKCVDREYGGYIYKKQTPTTPKYYYEEPYQGTEKGLPYVEPTKNKKVAALYHTHGEWRELSENEIFSGYTMNNGKPSGDKRLADLYGLPSYLGTPSRRIKRYTPVPGKPEAGKTDVIGKTKGCDCKLVEERGKILPPANPEAAPPPPIPPAKPVAPVTPE